MSDETTEPVQGVEPKVFAEFFFQEPLFDEASEDEMASPTACRGKLDDS